MSCIRSACLECLQYLFLNINSSLDSSCLPDWPGISSIKLDQITTLLHLRVFSFAKRTNLIFILCSKFCYCSHSRNKLIQVQYHKKSHSLQETTIRIANLTEKLYLETKNVDTGYTIRYFFNIRVIPFSCWKMHLTTNLLFVFKETNPFACLDAWLFNRQSWNQLSWHILGKKKATLIIVEQHKFRANTLRTP